MSSDVEGARPQDVGRSHSRRRRVAARALTAAERLELLEATPLDAYRAAIEAAEWLYAADELAVVMLRDVLAELSPPAPLGEAILGGPLPAPKVAIADRLKLWSLALGLAGELGLTADSRRRIGLELTPANDPGGPARAPRGPRSRRIDFGGE
jgi:hypothetical protein